MDSGRHQWPATAGNQAAPSNFKFSNLKYLKREFHPLPPLSPVRISRFFSYAPFAICYFLFLFVCLRELTN
jgi:hypothetical protein